MHFRVNALGSPFVPRGVACAAGLALQRRPVIARSRCGGDNLLVVIGRSLRLVLIKRDGLLFDKRSGL